MSIIQRFHTSLFFFCSHFASYDDKENVVELQDQEVSVGSQEFHIRFRL